MQFAPTNQFIKFTMQSLFDGMLIGSIVLTISGTTSLALFPKNAGAVLAGLVSGTVGTVLVNKRQKNQGISEAQLRYILQEEIKNLYEISQTNTLTKTQDINTSHQSLLLNHHSTVNIQKQDYVDLATSTDLNQKNIIGETDFISNTDDGNQEQDGVDSTASETQILIQELDLTPAKIISWLKQKNIVVEKYYTPSQNDEVLNKISQVLGKYYDRLMILHKAIKTSLDGKSEFTLNLANCQSQTTVTGCNQFCKLLVKSGLLSNYQYNSTSKILTGKLEFNYPGIITFFNGRWFERYIFQEINDILKKQNIEYQSLRNAYLKFSENETIETDLLFLVADTLLWIECKTGKEYVKYIPKYSKYKKQIGIDKDKVFLVKLGITIAETDRLTESSSITVVDEKQLLEKISSIVFFNE